MSALRPVTDMIRRIQKRRGILLDWNSMEFNGISARGLVVEAMLVLIHTLCFPHEAVYDYRFTKGLRKKRRINPPTHEREALYPQCLTTNDIDQTEDQLYEQMDQVRIPERLAALLIRSFFDSEKLIYNVLSSIQGKHIPTFYGTSRFLDASSPRLDTIVPGILVQFILGTNLSRIDPTKIELDTVCSTVVNIINAYSDVNVLNQDVRLENFIVKPNGSGIVMVGFGHCQLHREGGDGQAEGAQVGGV
ncbi:hypothetical protein B0J17DRAFT_629241 [Rhizoctonia solani]|nr:hypothetical protein B0J17DRAFT_629241 [Rhizoctonia solani]